MNELVHQLRGLNFSTVEAVLPDGQTQLMIRIHLQTYLDQPGQRTKAAELPAVTMTLEAALAFAEALRAHALRSANTAPPDGGPPAGSQAH